MNQLSDRFAQNKKWLYYSLIATFIWGLMAHGYGFLQSSFSHDSLNEFNAEAFGNNFKIILGRFAAPFYKAVFRTYLTLPWLIGVLSLLWIGLSVFLVIRLFKIESKVCIFLVAGVFTTNISVSSTAATFLHDFDCNMFALLCAVAAVYLWKNVRWGSLIGSAFITLSLGIYQSYITVAIVLVMFVCILEILNEESFKSVFVKGLKAVGMLLLGGGMYYVVMKLSLRVTNNSLLTGQYNTLDKPLQMTPETFLSMTKEAYKRYFDCIANLVSPYPMALVNGITVILFVVVIAALVIGLWNKRIPVLTKLLGICLAVLLPFAMNLMHVLTIGSSHELMQYAYWLFYLLVLLLADWLVKWLKRKNFKWTAKGSSGLPELPKCVCMLLILVLLHSNVQTANAMYLKKDLEQDAYLSLMTRVLYRMEDYEGYIPGTTQVVFVGIPEQLTEVIPGFETYRKPNGMYYSDVLNFMVSERCQAYFSYILSNPAVFAAEEVCDEMMEDPRVIEMPAYPAEECIAMINDMLVVKLG